VFSTSILVANVGAASVTIFKTARLIRSMSAVQRDPRRVQPKSTALPNGVTAQFSHI
jgi:hypothetical protein